MSVTALQKEERLLRAQASGQGWVLMSLGRSKEDRRTPWGEEGRYPRGGLPSKRGFGKFWILWSV